MTDLLKILGYVAEYWWVIGIVLGGVFLAATMYFGKSAMDVLKLLAEFFTKTLAGKIAALAIICSIIAGGLFQTGRNYEAQQCKSAELRQEIAGLKAVIDEQKKQIAVSAQIQQRDAARAYVDEIAARQNQELIDATPRNDATCLPSDAARRINSVGRVRQRP